MSYPRRTESVLIEISLISWNGFPANITNMLLTRKSSMNGYQLKRLDFTLMISIYIYIHEFEKSKEKTRLNRTLCPVKVQKCFLSTKEIKANELVTIMLNLMKVRIFCTEDSYFTCNLGKKSRS